MLNRQEERDGSLEEDEDSSVDIIDRQRQEHPSPP